MDVLAVGAQAVGIRGRAVIDGKGLRKATSLQLSAVYY